MKLRKKVTLILIIVMSMALLCGSVLTVSGETTDDLDDNPFGGWDDSDDPVAGPDGILSDDGINDDDDGSTPDDTDGDGTDGDSTDGDSTDGDGTDGEGTDGDSTDSDDADTDSTDVPIATQEDLRTLAQAVNTGTFEDTYGIALKDTKIFLTADIELTGTFEPIGGRGNAFNGEFDGGGFTISNLTINGGDDGLCQGFFGVIGRGGYVHGLNLDNINISGLAYIGGVAGVVEFARIENCTVRGTVSAGSSLAGGIAGVAVESTISGCISSGSVSAEIENAGGIAGMIAYNNGVISSCQSSMTVSTMWGAGGIAGNASNAAIMDCIFSGGLNSDSDAEGNIAGEVMSFDTAGADIEPMFDSEEPEGDGNE